MIWFSAKKSIWPMSLPWANVFSSSIRCFRSCSETNESYSIKRQTISKIGLQESLFFLSSFWVPGILATYWDTFAVGWVAPGRRERSRQLLCAQALRKLRIVFRWLKFMLIRPGYRLQEYRRNCVKSLKASSSTRTQTGQSVSCISVRMFPPASKT